MQYSNVFYHPDLGQGGMGFLCLLDPQFGTMIGFIKHRIWDNCFKNSCVRGL